MLAQPAGDLYPLAVDVLLTPAEAGVRGVAGPDSVAMVIDVVRATTTLSVMFDRGCARVLVAGDIPAARAFVAGAAGAYLLAGEVGGMRPPGFDLGNSPAEMLATDLAGREIVFSTTNGTRALRACAGARAILAGSLRNAEAACRLALSRVATAPHPLEAAQPAATPVFARTETASEAPGERAEQMAGIVLVCSGRMGRPAADDTLCAGVLVEQLERLASGYGYALQLQDGARLARAVATGTASVYDLLWQSAAGQAVVKVGLEPDLALCAELNASQSVPVVVGTMPAGLLVVEQAVG
jgi:2-phosphosulfolactate phosphatase